MQWLVTKMVRWDGHDNSLVCRAWSWRGQLHQSSKREGNHGRWANGRKNGVFCGKYNKQLSSVWRRVCSSCEHWNIRAQIRLFQPPGFPLDRSAPARMGWGTCASIFKCTTWLSVAGDVNPGLTVFSALDFVTGTLCRCTQSCWQCTSLSLTLL